MKRHVLLCFLIFIASTVKAQYVEHSIGMIQNSRSVSGTVNQKTTFNITFEINQKGLYNILFEYYYNADDDVSYRISNIILKDTNGRQVLSPHDDEIYLYPDLFNVLYVLEPGTYMFSLDMDVNYQVNYLFTVQYEGISPLGMMTRLLPSTPSHYANFIFSRLYTSDDGKNYLDRIQYFDGLGRFVQSVQHGITPTIKDLVILQEYDTFGRESCEWLPASVCGNSGAYVEPATLKTAAINSNAGDRKPYSYPVYEASPLYRILKRFSPGGEWHDNGKATEAAYKTNSNADAILNCKLYRVAGTGSTTSLIFDGNYATSELYVTEITDEDGNTSYEFRDKLEQLILTRRMDETTPHDTYYVYDSFGNKCFVLPPRIQEEGISQDKLDELAYQYKYDHRNRCIAKKIPANDWNYYIYDKADRLIFSQDGEQRSKKRWVFSIPDEFGRVAITGICANSPDYAVNPLGMDVVKTTRSDGTNFYKGYTTPTGVELIAACILSINYYDDYTFWGYNNIPNTFHTQYSVEEGYDTCYGDHQPTNKVRNKGLLTGGLTAQINFDGTVSDIYLYSVWYYDSKARPIQSKSNNHLSGGIDKEYIAYNFTGQPTARKHIHSATGKPTQTEEYAYTYDHAGRLLQTTHRLNGGATVTLLKNTYDELGRLLTTTANGQENLKSTYAYNIRSWTQGITNTHFVQTLGYTYGGNIHTQEWKQAGKTRKYSFDYDHLSRLTTANYTGDGQYGTGYTYDKHGNITTLQRSGNTGTSTSRLIDNLTLSYNGNQLIKVEDSAPTVSLTSSTDFVNGVNNATEYFYDLNGNVTKDLNKGISNITYNTLNLPSSLTISNAKGSATNNYVYAADGRKLSTTISGKRTDYAGNMIYENGNLKRILTENGYIEEGKYYFYIKDHLGNNRIVADQNGNVIQSTQYYPFGMAFADGVGESKQPYKYNSKELDTEKGLNWYDYSARYMEPALGRFTTVDPLAEKYYHISPYVYAGNNPIRNIDINGDSITVLI